MIQNKSLYESGEIWNQDIQLGQYNLIRAIKDIIPTDIVNVLDVGCGDGKITSELIKLTNKEITGFDSSLEALSRCGFETIQGDAADLPFVNNHYELVMSLDMLEHLPADLEREAWNEMFRVASKMVIIGVPFRENLLEASTICKGCSGQYHVNWHMRSYDWPDLTSKIPEDWKLECIVFSGEEWSKFHPFDIQFRREFLHEWAGWREAICPTCGLIGSDPREPSLPDPLVAASIGGLVYNNIKSKPNFRSHSEILLVCTNKTDSYTSVNLPTSNILEEKTHSCFISIEKERVEVNLTPYPDRAYIVQGQDEYIIQFPLMPGMDKLSISWRTDLRSSSLMTATVHDGLGSLYGGVLNCTAGHVSEITFSRKPIASYYGILVRIKDLTHIDSINLGNGVEILRIEPKDALKTGYYPFKLNKISAYLQINKLHYFDVNSLLHNSSNSKLSLESFLSEFSRMITYQFENMKKLNHRKSHLLDKLIQVNLLGWVAKKIIYNYSTFMKKVGVLRFKR